MPSSDLPEDPLRPDGPFALRAAGVWTMAGPDGGLMDDALILGDAGRVWAVGPYADLRAQARADVQDLGAAVLCPGLVNAHTHLGLSHARAELLNLGQGFLPWVQSLVPWLSKQLPAEALAAALAAGAGELRAAGTALAADVAGRNALASAQALDAAGLDYLLLLEFFGFATDGPGEGTGGWPLHGQELPARVWGRVAAGGHALYSTAPHALRRAKAWSNARGRPFSMHLAESLDEVELLRTGRGPMAGFYRQAGILPPDYASPGVSPVAHAAALGLLDAGTLAVHCVQAAGADLELLAASGAHVCLCPRSNALIGVGRAPWEELLRRGVNACLGTDGLCSNRDLNLWNELRFFLDRLDMNLTSVQALALVTSNPARALGVAGDYGSIAPGRRAAFATVPAWLAN